MAAPKGNKFWERRSTHGRKPIFASPDDLWDAATQYFIYVDTHPLYEYKAFQHLGKIKTKKLPIIRAMTLAGLCLYLDISRQAFAQYREAKDFITVTDQILDVIRSQKFEGAAGGLLNANIIARDLGLVDKTETKGVAYLKDASDMTDDEIRKELESNGAGSDK